MANALCISNNALLIRNNALSIGCGGGGPVDSGWVLRYDSCPGAPAAFTDAPMSVPTQTQAVLGSLTYSMSYSQDEGGFVGASTVTETFSGTVLIGNILCQILGGGPPAQSATNPSPNQINDWLAAYASGYLPRGGGGGEYESFIGVPVQFATAPGGERLGFRPFYAMYGTYASTTDSQFRPPPPTSRILAPAPSASASPARCTININAIGVVCQNTTGVPKYDAFAGPDGLTYGGSVVSPTNPGLFDVSASGSYFWNVTDTFAYPWLEPPFPSGLVADLPSEGRPAPPTDPRVAALSPENNVCKGCGE